jgi:SAM-dependent MidA family methyltransferase
LYSSAQTLSALGHLPVESVHLVEASEKMRDVQKEKLAARVDSLGATLQWADRVDSIQPGR